LRGTLLHPTLLGYIQLRSESLAQLSLAAFDKVVTATSGFRLRPGQHAMAACVAETLAKADLGEHANPTKAIAVIQAGTGVGKSAAYASTAIALALERKTRVLISTATVALQEQLMTKDLPALARTMDQPFVFALAKGRGRYVCKLKLERLVGSGAASDPLFDADDEVPTAPASRFTSPLSEEAREERRMALYDTMASTLATGSWDGDRDSLPETPDPRDWSTVAAERHTCTVRACPRFRDCSYYQARIRLSEANVIVANHDLVLASLGMKTLPDLDNCLVIFDEGHHLPAVALDQFSSAMDMSNLRWLDKLPKILQEVSSKLQVELNEDVATVTSQLKGLGVGPHRAKRPRRRPRRHPALCPWRTARRPDRPSHPNPRPGGGPVQSTGGVGRRSQGRSQRRPQPGPAVRAALCKVGCTGPTSEQRGVHRQPTAGAR
jgi:ATP-dependent DNA helicase DinG